jgi:protein SMG9
MSVHCTEGIDAFITAERVILLDCQPVLSLSVLAKCINSDNPNSNRASTSGREDQDYPLLENDMEIQSLQYAAFILSVCHVVLFIQDWVFDPDLVR